MMPSSSSAGLFLSAICKAHQFAVLARLDKVDNSEILAANAKISERKQTKCFVFHHMMSCLGMK